MPESQSTVSSLSSTSPTLLVIVGPTASGKSDLAMRVAKKFNGEIISADSLTIYKGMDIGTAKPTKAEQKRVKHWGLDIVGPGQRFTAAEFKLFGEEKIAAIQKREHLPIVVGGTGLYIDALVLDYRFGTMPDQKLRRKLEKLSLEELHNLIRKRGYSMPSNAQNRRHLIGTIERQGSTGSRLKKLPDGILVVGLMPDSKLMRKKINSRVQKMFSAGLIPETRQLVKKYGRQSLQSRAKVAYGPVMEYLVGELSLTEAKARLKTAHWQYARRQKTWFKRNKYIKWFGSSEPAFEYICKALNT